MNESTTDIEHIWFLEQNTEHHYEVYQVNLSCFPTHTRDKERGEWESGNARTRARTHTHTQICLNTVSNIN